MFEVDTRHRNKGLKEDGKFSHKFSTRQVQLLASYIVFVFLLTAVSSVFSSLALSKKLKVLEHGFFLDIKLKMLLISSFNDMSAC